MAIILLGIAAFLPQLAWARAGNDPAHIMAAYIKAINTRQFGNLNAVLSPELLQHFSDMGTEVQGSEALISRVQAAVKGAPDLHLTLARLIVNGDMFATMMDVTFSRDGKPAKQFWIDLWRIHDGKLVEHWES